MIKREVVKYLNCSEEGKMWFVELVRDLISDLPDMFRDWPVGTLVAIVISIASLVVISGVLWLTFVAVDSSFLPMENSVGRVVAKEFTPAHTTTTIVSTGKTTVPVTQHHPDSWSLTVQVTDRSGTINVYERFYNQTPIGALVEVGFVTGRISGGIYLRNIR